jgi:hypothetical protein
LGTEPEIPAHKRCLDLTQGEPGGATVNRSI